MSNAETIVTAEIFAALRAHGLSAPKLAARIGVPARTVQVWQTQRRIPKAPNRLAVLSVLTTIGIDPLPLAWRDVLAAGPSRVDSIDDRGTIMPGAEDGVKGARH